MVPDHQAPAYRLLSRDEKKGLSRALSLEDTAVEKAIDDLSGVGPIAGIAISDPTRFLAPQAFRATWDTADVRPRERYSYFREAMCQTFLACTPYVQDEAEIVARIEMATLNEGWAARSNTSIARLTRTPADITELSDEYQSLIMITGGQKQTDYTKTALGLRKGDVVLVGANQFFDSRKQSDGIVSQTGLTFKKSTLRRLIGADVTDDYIVVKYQPLASALSNCLEIIDRRLAIGSWHELSALSDACMAMVAALVSQDRDLLESSSDASPSVGHGLVAAIKRFVDQNLTDPDLSPPAVAGRFGVSVRYVHKLFNGEADTFSNYVLNCRLERVRSDLAAPSLADKALAEIAHSWGFRDMTTFHRTFKRRYDLTPSRMRASAKAWHTD